MSTSRHSDLPEDLNLRHYSATSALLAIINYYYQIYSRNDLPGLMWGHTDHSTSNYHHFSSSLTWKHLLHKLQHPGTKCNIFAKSFHFSFSKPNVNHHRRPCSLRFLPSDAAERAQRGRCIRVSPLYKVFPAPGASWRAALLDNYPQEYQKSSSKQDNKPTSALPLRQGAAFEPCVSSDSFISALTSVAPQSESVRRSPEGACVEVDGEQEGRSYRAHGQRQHQLEQIPERSPEPCTQQQQRAADAQAVKTCGRNRDKAQSCCRPTPAGKNTRLCNSGKLDLVVR